MERGRRIWSTLLTLTVILSGCMAEKAEPDTAVLEIKLNPRGLHARAADPDEELITDLNLIILDENGFMEESIWIGNIEDPSDCSLKVLLVTGKKYDIFACTNLGYRIRVNSVDELHELRYHLAYPDEYREGIPMSGKLEGIILNEDGSVVIGLERLMSKISLRIDRGGLSEGVYMDVVSVKIGNCPKSVRLFGESKVSGKDDCFSSGFSRGSLECDILNSNSGNGISGALSLYMLENMQGEFSSGTIGNDDEKVFDDNDLRNETCSFVEIAIDYRSDTYHTIDHPLIYRFYLGEDRNNLDVERNCHYHITIIPEDDGLSGNGWRVDKSGLLENDGKISFRMTPSGYIQGNIGDKIHIRCEYTPSHAEFDIGIEELEYDKERGIYDYTIDPDGKGVVLTLKSPGTGIVYMSAKDPINEAGMLVIEVNDIKNSII